MYSPPSLFLVIALRSAIGMEYAQPHEEDYYGVGNLYALPMVYGNGDIRHASQLNEQKDDD